MFRLLKRYSQSLMVRRSPVAPCCFQGRSRSFADTPHTDAANKQVVVQGPENEQRLRVRRARPSDVPRVLRFVREHSRAAWPALVSAPAAPSAASQLVLADYVSRALAQDRNAAVRHCCCTAEIDKLMVLPYLHKALPPTKIGHSMVAEQMGPRRGWLQVRALALGAAVCPWDAAVLERWARCLRCPRSRRLVLFTAHCLRAPSLHDKYRVHNVLQVILILPPDAQSNLEIIQLLAKSAIQRGREVGFPLLRFDVTSEEVAKALEGLQLKKEWQMSYDVVPDTLKDSEGTVTETVSPPEDSEKKSNFIAVYSAFTAPENIKT